MSRNSAARELQDVIEQLARIASRGERLAQCSGGLVDAKWFRSAHAMASMAAGDLDQQGLLMPHGPYAGSDAVLSEGRARGRPRKEPA